MEENKFTEQHLKDAFEFMDKKPVPNITDEDVELKFIADNDEVKNVVWLPKKDWDFNVAYRKYKKGWKLTEEEIKLLKLG